MVELKVSREKRAEWRAAVETSGGGVAYGDALLDLFDDLDTLDPPEERESPEALLDDVLTTVEQRLEHAQAELGYAMGYIEGVLQARGLSVDSK